MEFNKFLTAGLVIGSFALVGCGDEQKKEGDKVIEVPAATVTHDAPKTDVPATDISKPADTAVVTPEPAHDAAVVTPPAEPAHDAAVVTPPAVTETPNANVTVEETHKTETTTTPTN